MAYPTTSNNLSTTHSAGQIIASADIDAIATDVDQITLKVGTGASTPATVGNVLTATGVGTSAWQASPTGFTNPMTTTGDVITGGGAGVAQRLPIGSAAQVLTVVSGTPAWQTPASGFSNPMTTDGDLIARVAGATTRLPQGANGTYLGVSGGVLGYTIPPGGGGTSNGWVIYGGTPNSTASAGANVTAFASAISSLPAVGGTIYVKAGLYWVNNVMTVSTNNVRVLGEPGAIFKMVAGANQVTFALGNQSGYTTGIIFECIEIDGNAANQNTATASGLAGVYGICGMTVLKAYQVTIRDCYIHDIFSTGMQVNSCGEVSIINNTLNRYGLIRQTPCGGAITNVTNVINATVSTTSPHNLVTGQTVTISGVNGATGANGTWNNITVLSGNTYQISNGSAPGAYTSGGITAFSGSSPCNGISIYQGSLDGGVHPAFGFEIIGNTLQGNCDNAISANGNGSQGYIIAGNDISGTVTDNTGFRAAYWGIAVELETGDTVADQLASITGNVVKDQNVGVILNQYTTTGALVLQAVSVDSNTITNCSTAFAIVGQNITVTGNTAFNVNQFLSTNGAPDDAAVVNRAWVIANNSFTLSTSGGIGSIASLASGILIRAQAHAIFDGILIANNSGVGTGTSNLFSWHAGVITELITGGTAAVKNVHIVGNQFRNFGTGIWVKTPDAVKIQGNHCFLNGDTGIAVTSPDTTNTRSVVRDNSCIDNGRAAGATWFAGIELDCSDVMLRNNQCFDSAASGKLQQYGVRVSGTCTLASIDGDDLRGNANGAFGFLGNSSFTSIRNVRGYNPVGSIGLPRTGPTNTLPATPTGGTTYTNDTGYDCAVCFSGGTGAISIGGTSTGLTSGCVRVPAGQTVSQAAGGSLAWTWFAD